MANPKGRRFESQQALCFLVDKIPISDSFLIMIFSFDMAF